MNKHVRISSTTHDQLKQHCRKHRRTLVAEVEYALKALINGRIPDVEDVVASMAEKNGRNRREAE